MYYLVKKTAPVSSLLVYILSLSLMGCDRTPSHEKESVDNTRITSIKNLRIDRNNKLHSTYELDIDIDISNITQNRTYISICSDMKSRETSSSIDYKDCFLKSSIIDGIKSTQLRLPLHITKLVAILWFFESDQPPLVHHYSQSFTGEQVWNIH